MRTSPKGSKYSLSSGSVVFHGRPRTMRSEHLFFSTFLFLAVDESWLSSDFRLSAARMVDSKPYISSGLNSIH